MLRKTLFIWGTAVLLLTGSLAWGDSAKPESPVEVADLSGREWSRIAVMPFLTGRLETPDDPVEKPLSQSLQPLKMGAVNLVADADQILTRLVNNYLKVRYRDQWVPVEANAIAHAERLRDTTLDTPRKLAVAFGKDLGSDLVIVGTVWRYREKGTNLAGQDSPSSVAFAVYLVDVASGKRLWRNAFDGTQKILSEDVLGGLKQVKIGLRRSLRNSRCNEKGSGSARLPRIMALVIPGAAIPPSRSGALRACPVGR